MHMTKVETMIKENFIIFVIKGKIDTIIKFETPHAIQAVKDLINTMKDKSPKEIIRQLEKTRMINILEEPSSRFIVYTED